MKPLLVFMKLSDFDYPLPKELIAAYPPEDRTSARLLHVDRQTSALTHRIFSDLVSLLNEGDVLVLNNTKVLPARLFGQKPTGGKVEALLLKELDATRWEALLRPGGRIQKDTLVSFGENGERLSAKVLDDPRQDSGERLLEFQGSAVKETLQKIGRIPLPPYIDRPDSEIDREVYQTVFAEKEGAVASPTAGLHFNKELIQALEKKGVEIVYVTLHTSYGTFQPIVVEDVTQHKVMAEECEVSQKAADQLNQALNQRRRIISCGTTSTRTIEFAFQRDQVVPFQGKTDLFIYPSYPYKVASGLITNFHLPKTSLLLLVAAFLEKNQDGQGRERLFQTYEEAIREKYRFYSYGDAMVIM